jgi:hypothetical protein
MSIAYTYKHATGDTVICHGLDHPSEEGYYTGPLGESDDTETEWQVDPLQPIGADSATPLDRGNGLHVWPLWVERRYATETAARAAARALPSLLPRGAASIVVTGEEAGYKSTYANAVLQKLNTRRKGCSLDIIFQWASSVPVREAVS